MKCARVIMDWSGKQVVLALRSCQKKFIMVEQVEAHRPYLQLLSSIKVNRKIKQSLLFYGPDSLILVICSCAYNTLRGGVPLSKRHTIRLSPFKPFLKKVADRTKGVESKRKLLQNSLKKDSGQFGLPLLLRLCLDGSESGRIFITKPRKRQQFVEELFEEEVNQEDQSAVNNEQR